MKREDYSRAEAMAGQLMAASRKRVEDHDTEINQASNSAVAGADSMASLRARLYEPDRSSADANKRMLAHMDRIGVR